MGPMTARRARPLWLLPGLLLAAPAGDAAAATPSRQWLELSEQVVRDAKPGPPDAARIYAYVSVAYRDGLRATGDPAQAGDVARRVLVELLPVARTAVDRSAPTRLPQGTAPAPEAAAIVARLGARMRVDGRALDSPARAWRAAPRGPGKWVRELPGTPFNPTAGHWRRWVVAGAAFPVPPPPAFDSPRYRRELAAVRAAVSRRDASWSRTIDFWAGIPGTNTPAGIWLDRLQAEVADAPLGADDAAYSEAQAALAMTLADAFAECWKVKYRWWTARPSMVDPRLSLAMRNPPFPAYVSGHSTVSSAAAEVLAVLVPSKAAVWRRDAARARDSRLYAGIHFPSDNAQGFALGRRVGRTVVARLDLRSLEAR